MGTAIIVSLFSELILGILTSALEALDGTLSLMLSGMLKIEAFGASLQNILGGVQDMYNYIYGFACALMVVKFLYRGFEVWILWRNGDAENSPQDMLIGMGQAVVVMVGFPTLYTLMANVTEAFATGILGRFGSPEVSLTGSMLRGLTGASILVLLLTLIYLISAMVLFVKLLQRGIELLILRLGVPIACIGLLDSDYGLFQGYMQLIFRTLFASVLQICLFSISLKLVVDADLFSVLLSIAFLYTAYSGPSLLQQILIPGGRGGVSSAIHAGSSGVHLAKSIRSLIGK